MFSARYRQIIKDQTQCNVYHIQETTIDDTYGNDTTPEVPVPSFKCTPIGDASKDSIPGKKQTKVARFVDLVRHSRGGKTVYGYNPQIDMYNNPPPPIIDGLHHGTVPVRIRKNKF